ncbi:MAG TPA: LUD domain-containing protein [Opitutus sp.]|nr:LUD domain-containing protein [Opitutus sp.]
MAEAAEALMSDSRETILGRVRSALAPLPRRAGLPDWSGRLITPRQASGEGADPWETFSGRMQAAHGVALAGGGELVALMRKNGWRHGYIDPALGDLRKMLESAGITLEATFERARVDDYQFGITAAMGAIAETGTLLLSDRSTSSRLAALAPWVHVAVVRRERIFPDFVTAIAAFGDDPNIIWVTGPSKTADIEGILIEGVHGPGVQVALLAE